MTSPIRPRPSDAGTKLALQRRRGCDLPDHDVERARSRTDRHELAGSDSLRVEVQIKTTTPGTDQDAMLRREQVGVLLELLAVRPDTADESGREKP